MCGREILLMGMGNVWKREDCYWWQWKMCGRVRTVASKMGNVWKRENYWREWEMCGRERSVAGENGKLMEGTNVMTEIIKKANSPTFADSRAEFYRESGGQQSVPFFRVMTCLPIE
ncbi:hypothetical protein AVEN_73946-1 [Araneus ventricosus]|uniref:Uncharacterized protein n=1 Tax=Araneus ventricosus TaxID=182803 RepID=A0A4Y2JQT5_ARAVE|nr:hypothetical protein AVEN_73946-1 [Araneus ventricosus]